MTPNHGDHVAHYWNAYFHFRQQTGMDELAMRDLIRAIRDEVHIGRSTGNDTARLKKLLRMIEVELQIAASERAEYARHG